MKKDEQTNKERRKLPQKLKKNGFNYTQILRCGNYCIYEQDVNSGINYGHNEAIKKIKYYEVFKIKVRPEEIIKGTKYTMREVYPSNEDFGISAWAYRSLDKAVEKLMILKRHKK